ncbi:MOSC domain-containing protein [Rhodoferax sp. BAB1]|uniref:MOSC domain-containing protein n=1 Tax=Rhodoferax sp. BAB1 TaxID=2741720 RepID=UPI0015763D6E|nr:MOSC N-terminal beta barrel domain-containing protein [Rhodoferax sp. BAB1]QKO20459.1 MOSC N-terminal beta barrel domain-containing protein [Rhodoferax sp. BAB1]
MSALPTTPADVQARIARLFVYPVKSCAGIELSEALLTETGLDLDRAWMVVDSEGEFLSQREAPRMALIQPAFKRGGTELQLRAPGMLALHLRVDAVEAPTRVRVWDDEVPAYDMGDIAAQWFTDFLGLNEQGLPRTDAPKYRLVRFDPEHRRLSDRKWTGDAEALNQFSDGYPVLVLGQPALEGLNERLQARGHAPVDIRRFRPNIVLEGLEAHDEDRVGPLQIATAEGEAVLTPVKPCPRCPIPNINPDTAQSSPEVNDTLQTYRQDARVKGALTFGMNSIVMAGVDHVLRVGQPVRASYRFD